MKKAIRILLVISFVLVLVLTAVSCGEAKQNDTGKPEKDASDGSKTVDTFDVSPKDDTAGVGEDGENLPSADITLTFDGKSIKASEDTDAFVIDGSIVTLKNPGTYTLKGTLADGAVIVETDKKYEVFVIFDGVSITNTKGSPFHVKSCDKTTIMLADNTENVLTDAKNYNLPAGTTKPNACIYSSDDLTIDGAGKLTVNGNYNNGIGSKNDIRIKNGEIVVSAVNNAIKGNDSISVTGGKVTVTKCDDGFKSDNETEEGRGLVYIENAEINITADDDAIQSAQAVTIAGGKVTVNCGGKSINCPGDVNVAEGVLVEND